MAPAVILEQDGSSWRATEVNTERLIQKLQESEAGIIIFAQSLTFLSSPRLRNDFSTKYHVPSYFWTESFQRSNGFFGWNCLKNQDQTTTPSYSTESSLLPFFAKQLCPNARLSFTHVTFSPLDLCVRFVVKQYGINLATANGKNYVWYEMGFFGHWEPSGKMVLLCLDVPLFLRDSLRQTITSRESSSATDINWLSSTLLSQIVRLYDESVWALRDVVRQIEESRDGDMHDQPNFPFLHDVARHVIHSTETLDVAINTLDCMAEMVVETSISQTDPFIQTELASHKTILFNLRARSQALDARLRNEINLAFNLVALRDSKVNVQIGTATQADSAAMRTISLVTMAFLPATFVSTIFSMSFFNFSPNNGSGGESWVVSERIWIYWVFAGPLTAIALVVWFMRERGWKNVLKSLRNFSLGN